MAKIQVVKSGSAKAAEPVQNAIPAETGVEEIKKTPPADTEQAPEQDGTAPDETPDAASEQTAAKRGRPRIPLEKKALPKPPHFKYATDQPRGRQPADFFRYWSQLDPLFQRRLLAYVYRTWPVVEYEVPTKSGFRQSRQQAKVAGEDPITGMEDVLHRFGSGDYVIRLNDHEVEKTICMCTITGLRDMENHPPMVPDLDWLVMDDPANQSYIHGLRLKGVRFPGDEPEGGEMAAGIDRLATTLERVVLSREDERVKDREQGSGKKKDLGEEVAGMKAVVEVMREASGAGTKIISEAITKANEMRSKESDPASALDMVKTIVGLIAKPSDEGKPKPEDPLLKTLLDSIREENKQMRAQIATLEQQRYDMMKATVEKAINMQAPKLEPPKSFKDTIKEMTEVRELFKDFLGIPEEEEKEIIKSSDRDPIWARVLLGLMNNLPAALTTMSYNLAMAKAGGTPVLPQPNPAAGALAAGQTEPGGGAGEEAGADYRQFLTQIRAPFLRHIRDNIPGGDFAALMTDWTGDPLIHEQLKDLGKEGLIEVLKSDPVIGQIVERFPQRGYKFVAEFIAWDINETGEQGTNGEGEPQTAAAG